MYSKEKIVSLHEAMKTRRQNFDNIWRRVAQYIKPSDQYFNEERTQGQQQMQYVFDTTAIIALNRFAASMSSYMTPVNQKWHSLALNSVKGEAPQSHEIDKWLEGVRDTLFALRYRVGSGFDAATNECYLDVGAFGNASLFIDYEPGRGPIYRSIPLYESYWLLNQYGRVDTFHRDFKMTSRQIVEQFGDDAPKPCKEDNEKAGLKEWNVIHSVHPNPDYVPDSQVAGQRKFVGCYLIKGTDTGPIAPSYYRTFPYAIFRYQVSAREDYARGIGMMCLADVLTLNQMAMTNLDSMKLATQPPLLATEDLATIGVSFYPSAVNYGGIDPTTGRPNIIPLETRVDLNAAFVSEDRRREIVNQAFMVDLFSILADRPNMTATEVLQRAQERGVLTNPFYSRSQAEGFGPMIERELDIAMTMSLIDDPPEEIAGRAELSIVYESPLAKAMRSEDGIAILNFMQGLAAIAQFDPKAPMLIDGIEMTKNLAKVYGLNASNLKSNEQVEQEEAAEQQQLELQNLLAAAPVAASAAKDLGQAAQTATFSPDPIMGI